MRYLVRALIVLPLLFTSGRVFAVDPFVTHHEIDLTRILPPPPPADSAQTTAEINEILAIQLARTPAMEARAIADSEQSVWRYADVLGASFTKEMLPTVGTFFDRVAATESAVVNPSKQYWNRLRPYAVNSEIHPIVGISNSGSWPSGHATVGTMMGIILANMVPEKRMAIMSRAWEYGHNRVIAGVHFRSDVEMGRISGSVIAATIMWRGDFKMEFEAARAELRAHLGM